MATISGTVLNPIGTPLTDKIRIVCILGSGSVLTSSQVEITPAAGGTYAFTLQNGDFEIYFFQDNQWNSIGQVRVEGTTANSNIMDLILNNPIPAV